MKAIKESSSIKLEKFESLKDRPKIWIGRLESAIVDVGGSLDTHAQGVLGFFLDKEDSKW